MRKPRRQLPDLRAGRTSSGLEGGSRLRLPHQRPTRDLPRDFRQETGPHRVQLQDYHATTLQQGPLLSLSALDSEDVPRSFTTCLKTGLSCIQHFLRCAAVFDAWQRDLSQAVTILDNLTKRLARDAT